MEFAVLQTEFSFWPKELKEGAARPRAGVEAIDFLQSLVYLIWMLVDLSTL